MRRTHPETAGSSRSGYINGGETPILTGSATFVCGKLARAISPKVALGCQQASSVPRARFEIPMLLLADFLPLGSGGWSRSCRRFSLHHAHFLFVFGE